MKTHLLLAFTLAMTPSLRAEGPADDVKSAATKLANAGNYSWTTSSAGQEGRGGMSIEGKTDTSGTTCLKSTFGDRSTESVIKSGKVAVKTEEGWKSGEELAAAGPGSGGGGGGGRRSGGGFAARMAQNFKAPATEAENLATNAKELKKDGDIISGELTEEIAKRRLNFGGPRRGGDNNNAPPSPANAKGSVKFWIKDGLLAKYEVSVSGTFERDGESRDINRTTTTEIKDAGATKLEIPAEATAKLSSGNAKPEEKKTEEKKTEENKTEAKKEA